VIEKVDPNTAGERKEYAVYVVTPAAARIRAWSRTFNWRTNEDSRAGAGVGLRRYSADPHDDPGAHRMEIALERLDNGSGTAWTRPGDGAGDRVRFRFNTNFDGYLYVMNQSTSGKCEQLFPREETGQDNRVVAGSDYSVPSTSSVFRIAGPAGFEIVYWLITPARLTDAPPSFPSRQPRAKRLQRLWFRAAIAPCCGRAATASTLRRAQTRARGEDLPPIWRGPPARTRITSW